MQLKRFAALAALSALTWQGTARAVEREACFNAAETAQQLRTAGKLRRARKDLLVCADHACPSTVQSDCVKWLAEVNEGLPSVVVNAHDPQGNDLTDVHVFFDDEPLADHLAGQPMEVDAGVHKLRFERTGSKPVEKSMVIGVGQKLRQVVVELAPTDASAPPGPPPPPKPASAHAPLPVLAIVLGGVGVVALGTMTYFWVKGRSEYSDLKASCGSDCDPALVRPVRTKLIVGDVSLGVAAASLGIATFLVLSRPHADRSDASPDATVSFGVEPRLDGAIARVIGQF